MYTTPFNIQIIGGGGEDAHFVGVFKRERIRKFQLSIKKRSGIYRGDQEKIIWSFHES